MNIILFGPPGVGKSTSIGYLKTRGLSAIDLEDLYPSRLRFQIPNVVTNTVLGAADLNPKRKYRNCVKVFLYADQRLYEMRRSHRDSLFPGKATQTKHVMSDWLKDPSDFDVVFDTTPDVNGSTREERLDALFQLVKKYVSDK